MCGIAGSYQLDATRPVTGARIQEALRCIAHRGPDDEGVFAHGRTVLGHRRLSIIDTSPAGHQPFTDAGGRYTMVYNGELFNFPELRAQLEAEGHTFRSHSDTEVVLRLFVARGPDFLHALNGFFALAIHDAENDTLLVARDRFGIKPLLWSADNGVFRFASELRALIALGAPTPVDPDAVAQYFTYHYTPGPHTVLRGVHELEPGRLLHVDAGGVRESTWYHLPAHIAPPPATRAEAVVQLRELMDSAVRLRLLADVPLGAFLSGGLDSSIVSALAARHHPCLHTFSIGYTDDPYFDESAHAQAVADHIGSTHHAFRLSTADLAEGYTRFLDAVDRPFADSSALAAFLLAERTRRHVAVALSGDGADELFGGYRKHQAELRARQPDAAARAVTLLGPLWRVMPRSRNHRLTDLFRQLDRFARIAAADPPTRWTRLAAMDADGDAPRLLGGRTVPPARDHHMVRALNELPGMNGVLLADVRTVLPYDMLYKVDITSMAHALEVRPPFLDRRVVEFAFGLPADWKLARGNGKALLRDAFGWLLPAEVLTRRKQGFEVPLRRLFTGALAGLVRERLAPGRVAAAGLAPDAVAQVVRRLHSARPGNAQATVHALLVYMAWWERVRPEQA